MAVVDPFDGEDVLKHVARHLEAYAVIVPVEGRFPIVPFAHLTKVMAPMIRSGRMSRCSIFDVRPGRGLPRVVCCRGTRPSQAAKSRPRMKVAIGANAAAIAPMSR